jgi:hypothetical protein
VGRPKKSVPAHVEHEDEVQESPEEEPARILESASAATMSKADACRAALAAGIEDAEKAQEFTRSKFGVEIKATDFSLYKSKQKKVATPAPKAKPGRKPKAATPLVEGYVAPAVKPKAAGEPDVLLALEGVKELVSQFGPERVKKMVDLLS